MIVYNNKSDITNIYYRQKSVDAVYVGGVLVWQRNQSCYGAGYWIDKYPWVDNIAWVD